MNHNSYFAALEIRVAARRGRKLHECAAIDGFVCLGELARDHGAAVATKLDDQVGECVSDTVRRLKKHQRACFADQDAPSLRAPRLRGSRAGRNPSKQNRLVGKPATASAVVMAEGPGMASTSNPALAAWLTSS